MGNIIAKLWTEIGAKTDGFEKGMANTKAALVGAKGGVNTLVQSLTGFSIASLAGAGAVGLVASELKRTTEETVKYAAEIRSLSRITGDSAESTSRLVQVADDLMISEEALGAALQGAVRKGVDVSIEGIAKLSDAYLNLEPGLERSKFLMDNFGRSGMNMAAMMEKGSAGIKEMSDGIADNLLMTNANVKSARQFEIAMDDLGDAFQGIKYDIGNALIPPLTEAAKTFTLLTTMSKKYDTALNENEKNILNSWRSYQEYADAVLTTRVRIGDLTEEQKQSLLVMLKNGEEIETLTDFYKIKTEVVYNAYKMIGRYNLATVEQTGYLKNLETSLQNAKNATEDLAISEANIQAGMERASLYMGGEVTEIYDKFTQKNIDLYWDVNKLQGEIDKLEKQSWLTPEQKASLDDLHTELGKTKTAIEANEKAYDKESKMFIVNTMEKIFTASGGRLDESEFAVLNELKERWGLIDEKTKLAVDNVYAIDAALKTSKLSAEEFVTALTGIPASKDVTVNIHYQSFPNAPFGPSPSENRWYDVYGARDSGGPVLAGMPYAVGKGGPETFVPNQSGYIYPAGGNQSNEAIMNTLRALPRQIGMAVRDAVQMAPR